MRSEGDTTPDDFETVDTAFTVAVVVGVIFFALVVVVIVYSVVKNVRRAKQLGLDPMTMQTELQGRLLTSRALQPERSVEARLQELDDLRARGVITTDEYAAARAEALHA